MSVVCMIVGDGFSLLLGDTRLTNNPNNRTTIQKVFKKDEILLGYTGTLKEVGEYLYPILTPNYTLDERYTWGTPESFFNFLDVKFYHAIESNTEKDITFVVCAKIGHKYVAKYYCLVNSNGREWHTETIVSTKKIQYFYIGDSSHKKYFKQRIDASSIVTLNDLKNMFQDTLNYGINYDETINNEMEYEYI